MTMASGPDGRPQVYQETMSSTMAPGGVKEVKTTVCDSRTGLKKMAIGHHIGDRAHILEREQNLHSGEQEERQEFINLEEGNHSLHLLLRHDFSILKRKKYLNTLLLQRKQTVLIMNGSLVHATQLVPSM